ncbi:MAG: DUF4252 domain-containing protein [Candidatus Zhuqueibacterota bacterium]
MKKRCLSVMLLFILMAGLLPGCVFVSRDFRTTRNAILSDLGNVDVDTEFQMQFNSGLISLGKMVVSMTDADREVVDYLRDIRNVQIGVYKLHDIDPTRALKIPKQISEKLSHLGYESVVKANERNGAAWVFTQIRRDRLESVYIISLEPQELVIVEVKGRLERILQKAIHDGVDRKFVLEM